MNKLNLVLLQEWLESEAGWGQRPDGYSLHKSSESLRRFVKAYWDSMPDRGPGGSVPDCYSRPCGEPYMVEVDTKTYKKLQKCGSQRFYDDDDKPERYKL